LILVFSLGSRSQIESQWLSAAVCRVPEGAEPSQAAAVPVIRREPAAARRSPSRPGLDWHSQRCRGAFPWAGCEGSRGDFVLKYRYGNAAELRS